MARETRHLWVGNLPENIREERIKEHFKRFGRVQSVKILGTKRSVATKAQSQAALSVPSNNNNNNGDLSNGHSDCFETATVAFMDITSACKALSVEHSLDDRKLHTDFYDPTRNNNNNGSGGSVGVPNSPSVSVGSNHSTAASGSRGSSPDVVNSRIAASGTDAFDGTLRSSSSHHTIFRSITSASSSDNAAAPNFGNAAVVGTNASRTVGSRLSKVSRGAFVPNGTATERSIRPSWSESMPLSVSSRVLSTEKDLSGSSSPLFKTSVDSVAGNSSPAHSTASSTGSAGHRAKSRSHRDHSHRRHPTSSHNHRSHNHHSAHHHHRTSSSSHRRSSGSNRMAPHNRLGKTERSRRSEEERINLRVNGHKTSRIGEGEESTLPSIPTPNATTTSTMASSVVDDSPSSSGDERSVTGGKESRRRSTKFGSKSMNEEMTSISSAPRRSCSTSSSSSRASSTSHLTSSSENEDASERGHRNRPKHNRHRHRDRHRRSSRGLEHVGFHSRANKAVSMRHQSHNNAAETIGRRREALTPTRTNCAILVRHLNARTSDLCLKESLISEYKKLALSVVSVRLVRPSTCLSEDPTKPILGRYAIVYFASKVDALKAVEETERVAACCSNTPLGTSPVLGNASSGAWASGLEVEPFLLDDTLVEHKRLFHRPSDAEMDEFHPNASRTLHVGNLMLGGPKSMESSSTMVELLKEKLSECGEILEVDLKRSQGYAWVQFKDVRSVCTAIKRFNATDASVFSPTACTGLSSDSELNRLKLGFARPMLTKCVWCRGFGADVTKDCLVNEFAQFGKVDDVCFDDKLGQALVYFDQILSAQRATLELRGHLLGDSRIECDYASHESRSVFFESCRRAQANLAPKLPSSDGVTPEPKKADVKASEKSCTSNGVADASAKDPRSYPRMRPSAAKSNPHHENISDCSSDEEKSSSSLGTGHDEATGKLLVSSLSVLTHGRQRKNRLANKTRRLSSERGNLLDLASSPREIPLVPKHVVSKARPLEMGLGPTTAEVKTEVSADTERHSTRQVSRSEPMSLPLPKFAQELFSSSSCSIATKVRRPSRDRDPRLHVSVSVATSTSSSVSAQLKSPPATAPAVTNVSSIFGSPKQPYTNAFGAIKDPRLRSPVSDTNSHETDNDASNTLSDGHSLSLDERLKALDEKFERWSSGTLAAGMTPSSQTATTPGSGSSGSMTPSFFKYTSSQTHQPSLIVQKLLSRRSVFDEDSKRLESLSQNEQTRRGTTAKTLSLDPASSKPPITPSHTPSSAPALLASSQDRLGQITALPFTNLPHKLAALPAKVSFAATPVAVNTTTTTRLTATTSSPTMSLPKTLAATTTTSMDTLLSSTMTAALVSATTEVTTSSTTASSVTSTTASTSATTTALASPSVFAKEPSVDVTTPRDHKPDGQESNLVTNETANQPMTKPSLSASTVSNAISTDSNSAPISTLPKASPTATYSASTPVTSSVQGSNKTIGQVKPLMHTGETLGTKLTANPPTHMTATATPIKPLVARPTPATAFKPSATVQPTIKQSGSSIVSGSHHHHPHPILQRKVATPTLHRSVMEKSVDANRSSLSTTPKSKMSNEPSNENDIDVKRENNTSTEAKKEEECKPKEIVKKKPSVLMSSCAKKEKSIKKQKDNELKDFLIGKDTIPHATKKDVKVETKITVKKENSGTESTTNEGTKHHRHHHHHHKRDRESSGGHHHRHSKKRKSSKSESEHKSGKVAKLASKGSKHEAEENLEGEPETKKAKVAATAVLANSTTTVSNADVKMGRIPKIKKEVSMSSDKKRTVEKDSKVQSVHNKVSLKPEIKSESKHRSSKKHKSSKSERSGKESDKKRKNRMSIGSEDEEADTMVAKTSKAKKTSSRRKSNASASGNSSRRSNKFSNSESSQEGDSSDTGDRSKGKFSIFDEPSNLFDADNPVYFSMYDKVKARRSCVKSREEQDRKKQEELLAKFSRLKEKRAGSSKKSIKTLHSDDDERDNDDEEMPGEIDKPKSSKKKSRHHLISSSSSDDDEQQEAPQRRPQEAHVIKKKRDESDENVSFKSNIKRKTLPSSGTVCKTNKSEAKKKPVQKPEVSASSSSIKLDSKPKKSKKSGKSAVQMNFGKITSVKKSATEIAFGSSDDVEDDDEDGTSDEESGKRISKKPATGPRVSAVAKVKEAMSSSDDDNSIDEQSPFESVKRKSSKSLFEKSSCKEQSSSDSDLAEPRSGTTSVKSKQNDWSVTSRKNDLDKRMSNIFGSSSSSTSSSSDEDNDTEARKHPSAPKALPVKNRRLSDTDDNDDSATKNDVVNVKTISETANVKKRRPSSKCPIDTSSVVKEEPRETAESLFDQLTTNTLNEEKQNDESTPIKSESMETTSESTTDVKLEQQPLGLSKVLQSELEKSIASITPSENDETAPNNLEQKTDVKEDKPTTDPKEEPASKPPNISSKTASKCDSASSSDLSQISQEETAQAVTALLGESFVDAKEQEFMEEEGKANHSFIEDANDSVKKEADQETESAVANLIEGNDNSKDTAKGEPREDTLPIASSRNVCEKLNNDSIPVNTKNTIREASEDFKTEVQPDASLEATSMSNKMEVEESPPNIQKSNFSSSSEDDPRAKLDTSNSQTSKEASPDDTTPRRGRGGARGSRRGGRGRSASASEANVDMEELNKTRGHRGGRGQRGTRGRGTTRGATASTTTTAASATTTTTPKTTRGTRGGRGSRGARGAAAARGAVVGASVCGQRRQSLNVDTSNLAISAKSATSIFDWPEEMDEEAGAKQITSTATTSQQEPRGVIRTESKVVSVETKPKAMFTTPSSSAPPVFAQTLPPTPPMPVTSCSSKPEVSLSSPSSVSPSKLADASDETKIKAILEQAKREQLVHELELEKIGALKPLQIMPTACVTLGNDITVTKYVGSVPTAMLPASVSTPTVLTQRHLLRTSPHGHPMQQLSPVVRGGQQVVQLPTQPLSPSEICSQTTPASKPSNVIIEANKTNSVMATTAIPANATNISLPTQPVPRAMAVANAVFPNQPLPMGNRGATVAAVSEAATLAAALHLPQHPLPLQPPTVTSKPLLVQTTIESGRPESVTLSEGDTRSANSPAHMHPKKYMKARDAFGNASRRQKLQPPQISPEDKGEEANAKLAAAAAEQQMALLRTMEAYDLNLYYQHYLGKGHPEHLALSMTQQALQERYGAKDLNLVLGQPTSTAAAAAAAAAAMRFQPPSAMPGATTPAFLPADLSAFGPAVMAPPTSVKYNMSPFKAPAAAADSPASPPPSAGANTSAGLESYPVVWQGFLGLKTELATVQIHYVSGCRDVAKQSLPLLLEGDANGPKQMPTLMIQQRLRLEEDKLEDVRAKMERASEHCVLLALPCGRDTRDVEDQSTRMRKHFITYLQLKSAAGIVNLRDNAFVLHVFPSCDFANKTMSDIAPDLLARVAEIEHMVIVITTTT